MDWPSVERIAMEAQVRGVIAFVVLVFGAVGAAGQTWSVVGQDAYGCKSTKDLAQLRLMSTIKVAFELALADKIESGVCVKLRHGEPAAKFGAADQHNRQVFKVKGADGTEYFVDARFVERTL